MNIYKNVVLSDIDGTLANISHRLPFIKTKPKNWPAFMAGIAYDLPIKPMVHLLQKLAEAGQPIVLASGRSDDTRDATLKWLDEKCDIILSKPVEGKIFAEALYMRKKGDYRSDDIVKEELLDQMLADGYNPICVFDDRPRVVKMWRSRGIFVCDVNQSGVDF